jgi:fermentation-respiration switch protein FrsA (DUF1100 family)
MRKFGSRTAAAALGLVAIAATLAACGGSASSAGTNGGANPSATPVPVSALPLDVTQTQVLSLFAYDTSKPLDIKDVTSPKTKDGVTIRDITFVSSDGTSAAAWLVAPSGTGPFAAILFLHWLGTFDSDRGEFLADATALAKRGVVSLLPTRLFPGVANPTDWRTDRQSIVAQTTQLRRGLDLLLAQPGVDANRLAFVGHDYGAMDGAGLAAVDKRLKAVALLTLDATWADWFFNYFSFAPSDKPEYAQAMKQFDPVVLLPQIAPTPLFLQFSARDQFVSAEVAQQLTDAAPSPKKATTYPNVSHALQQDATATADRDAWLTEALALPR